MRFLGLFVWFCVKAPYCAHMSPVWSTLVHAERPCACGGLLIHSGVMELSLREAAKKTTPNERRGAGGRARDRGCNLSSFVLFYARIFRRPLLGRRALAHAPAHRVCPDSAHPGGPLQIVSAQMGNTSEATTATGDDCRIALFYLLRSLPLSTVLWGTSSVKSMECAALLDSIVVLFYVMVGF